jgi:hypothetical protein
MKIKLTCGDGFLKHSSRNLGDRARVAVLPQGPLTIPYLKTKSN